MTRRRSVTARSMSVALALVLVAGVGLASAQVGTQLAITMNLAGPAKIAGGAYFIALTINDTILRGPQADSSNWTHYILYRQGRFFFGLVPAAPFRPFEFVTIRPPQPLLSGQLLPDGRSLYVRVPLADLRVGPALPTQIKVNFVTVDEVLRPLDALGQGPTDRFGFVTLDLRKDTYLAVTHIARNCPDPAFCITGGNIQLTTP